jgi:protein phosphatase
MPRTPCTYRIAVLSDIHGNLPAFEAALAEIERSGPIDGILVAGDMVGAPGQETVIERLRARNAVMIQGNWEETFIRMAEGRARPEFSCASQFAMLRWVQQRLPAETLAFLKNLPQQRTVRFPGAAAIRLAHGSPRHIAESIEPHALKQQDEILARVPEPVLLVGHTHEQWMAQRDGHLIVNSGGVSGPNDCVGAQYALLHWDGDRWSAELRLAHYDVADLRALYRESGYLDIGPFPRLFLYACATGEHLEHALTAYARQKAAEAGFPETRFIPDAIWDQVWPEFLKSHHLDE